MDVSWRSVSDSSEDLDLAGSIVFEDSIDSRASEVEVVVEALVAITEAYHPFMSALSPRWGDNK